MRAALLLAVVGAAGCGFPLVDDRRIVVDGGDHLHAVAEFAVGFWAAHGVTITIDDAGPVTMTEVEHVGGGDGLKGGYSVLDQHIELEAPAFSCAAAHEIGHALGLAHDAAGLNLMSPIAVGYLKPDGELDEWRCPWSADDEAELDQAVAGMR